MILCPKYNTKHLNLFFVGPFVNLRSFQRHINIKLSKKPIYQIIGNHLETNMLKNPNGDGLISLNGITFFDQNFASLSYGILDYKSIFLIERGLASRRHQDQMTFILQTFSFQYIIIQNYIKKQ